MTLTLLIGLLVGAIMGITGAGGGVLAVPALVTLLGMSMQEAAPVALVAMVGAAGAGAIEGLQRHIVRYRAAILIALVSLPFTSLGVQAAHALPQQILMRIFVLVMLISAVRSWQQAGQDTPADRASKFTSLGPIHGETGRFIWTPVSAAVLAMIGALTGFMAGLLGVGGGFIIVPMLRRFTQLSIHGAVATALLIIALISSGGVVSTVAHGARLPWSLTIVFASAAMSGMLISRRLARKLSAQQVLRAFAALLLVVSLGLGIKSID